MIFNRFLLFALLTSLVACGGGSDSGSSNPPPPPPPVNSAPTVNAGPNQTVVEQTVVQLVGTANDINNDPLTYRWTQTVGTTVTLTGADTPNVSFTAPMLRPAQAKI
jgi:hypothetical protein